MLVTFHFTCIILIILFTLVIIVQTRDRSNRALFEVLIGITPVIMLGVITSMLLRINGTPTVEWALPAICILLLGMFGNSKRDYNRVLILMYCFSLMLCLNFLILTHNDYTSDPERTIAVYDTQKFVLLRKAKNALIRKKRLDINLIEAPVSRHIDNMNVDEYCIKSTTTVKEWHSFITRLYRVSRTDNIIWHRGGKVMESGENLELRPVTHEAHET